MKDREQKVRRVKTSFMKNRQPEIDALGEMKEFVVHMVFKDNFPFWCEIDQSEAIEHVTRLNRDAEFERYKYKKCHLKILE